eukprot:4308745-Prymnesium_polylepis.2
MDCGTRAAVPAADGAVVRGRDQQRVLRANAQRLTTVSTERRCLRAGLHVPQPHGLVERCARNQAVTHALDALDGCSVAS